MQFHRAAEVAFRQGEIAGLEVLLAETEIVIGRSLRRRGRWVARGRPYAAGRGRIVLDRGARVGLRLEQIAKPRRALAAVEPQQARDRREEDSSSSRSHWCVPPAAKHRVAPAQAKTPKRCGRHNKSVVSS